MPNMTLGQKILERVRRESTTTVGQEDTGQACDQKHGLHCGKRRGGGRRGTLLQKRKPRKDVEQHQVTLGRKLKMIRGHLITGELGW
jgi:hypothetical protein